MDKKKKTTEPVAGTEPAKEADPALPQESQEPVQPQPAPDPLRKELEAAQEQAEDFKRKWYSVTAEYENYRKRTAAQSAQRYRDGRADVIKGLFPVADNLERALQSCAEEGTKKGIEMVIKSFRKLLEEENVAVIDPKGERFDPEKCEAIMAVEPQEGEESGVVREVFLKGYEQNGKVLRYAQVSVVK